LKARGQALKRKQIPSICLLANVAIGCCCDLHKHPSHFPIKESSIISWEDMCGRQSTTISRKGFERDWGIRMVAIAVEE
jgi:hypothetical protein